MAVFKTNIQSSAALGEALSAADAAAPRALRLSSGLERFEGGAIDIFFASSTQITGHFLRANGMPSPISFSMWGSFSPDSGVSTVRRLELHDSSTWPPTVAVLAFYGDIRIISDSEFEDPTITGSINRIRYTSAEVDVSMRGNLDVQAFESDSVSGITHVDIRLLGEPDVRVALTGNFTFGEDGEVSGRLTGLRFELDDQFFQVTGLNRSYSVLLTEDVDAMLAAMLKGNDKIVGDDVDQALRGYAGRDSIYGAGGDDSLMGGGGSDSLIGGGGDDTLIGGGGRDYLTGGAGIDRLDGGSGDDTLLWRPGDFANGGEGYDTLRVSLSDLDLVALPAGDIVGVEEIDMRGGLDSTLTLNEQEVLDLSATTDVVTVRGGERDSVSLADVWDRGDSSGAFTTWTRGTATLKIENDLILLMP